LAKLTGLAAFNKPLPIPLAAAGRGRVFNKN